VRVPNGSFPAREHVSFAAASRAKWLQEAARVSGAGRTEAPEFSLTPGVGRFRCRHVQRGVTRRLRRATGFLGVTEKQSGEGGGPAPPQGDDRRGWKAVRPRV
jgi:hypothetical protein